MHTDSAPVAKSGMLIRKPASEVFEALVNPEITSKFWFTESSGRLEADKTVEWTWGQFGVSGMVTVKGLKQDQLIRFEWPSGEDDSFRTVEISFEPQSDKKTFVQVVEKGFDKDDEQLVEKIAGQTEGWALVLSALKAYLEHDIILNVVTDHKPTE
jgi:uncharacterized protein YndB with AHSA1/START domain